MIGADTNILARAFLEDDKIQSKEGDLFLDKAAKFNELFISFYAILEFMWVLKTKKISRELAYDAIVILCDSPGIVVADQQLVLSALEKYKKGKADFGDYMILSEGEFNKTHKIKTFDKILQKELAYKVSLNVFSKFKDFFVIALADQ